MAVASDLARLFFVVVSSLATVHAFPVWIIKRYWGEQVLQPPAVLAVISFPNRLYSGNETTVTVQCACRWLSAVAAPAVDEPYQPVNFKFLKSYFRLKKVVFRCLQSSWFGQRPFLHYNETKDVTVCHICLTAFNLFLFKLINLKYRYL